MVRLGWGPQGVRWSIVHVLAGRCHSWVFYGLNKWEAKGRRERRRSRTAFGSPEKFEVAPE